MKISSYTGGMAATNGYLVETTTGNFLIDAPSGISGWLQSSGVRVDDVLLTHQHYDHVEDASKLQSQGAKLHAYADYSTDLTLETAARQWGMPIAVQPYMIDAIVGSTSPIKIAGKQMQISHIPGHASDSLTFYFKDEGVLFSGDTLFAGSIGRTDLPGGSHPLLLEGIARHLMVLPEATRVLSGHGPETTIGREAASNPFLR